VLHDNEEYEEHAMCLQHVRQVWENKQLMLGLAYASITGAGGMEPYTAESMVTSNAVQPDHASLQTLQASSCQHNSMPATPHPEVPAQLQQDFVPCPRMCHCPPSTAGTGRRNPAQSVTNKIK